MKKLMALVIAVVLLGGCAHVDGRVYYIEAETVPVHAVPANAVPGHAVPFSLATNIGKNFESVGPSGSGATHLWADLDAIPFPVQGVLVKVSTAIEGAVAGQAYGLSVFARKSGSTAPADAQTLVSDLKTGVVDAALNIERAREIKTHFIPMDERGRFDVQIIIDGTLPNAMAVLHLVGWISS